MSLSILTALCLSLVADELSLQQKAQIERDNDKAQAEVDKKYGNRPVNQLSADERRSIMKEKAAAEQKVLDKHGISPQEWVKTTQKIPPKEWEDRKAAKKQLEEKEAADAEAAKKGGDKEVEVQRGISDDKPVTLEEKPAEDGVIQVEKSIPTDAADDQREAEGGEAPAVVPGGDDEPAPRPASKGGGKGKGGKKR
ncbi:MAG: hypothetical protein DI536_12540 [Archangium gephyra]|uniref:Uncharacterized protein n=1 Tax=Archangium gephyra TaxID=48 RepID=A0A2W5TDF2_9BACT|nr:MAG: hypothetical protein DI536_12540 [Archangium gephyra]